MESERRRLMESMQARLRMFTEEGDPSGVLDPAADSEAQRLRALMSTAGSATVGAYVTLAWFRWHRFTLLAGEQQREELHRAIHLFHEVYSVDPSLVPEPIRKAFSQTPPTETTSTHTTDSQTIRQIQQANELMMRHDSTGNLDLLNRAVDLLQQAVDESNREHRIYSSLRSTLGDALIRRYSLTQSVTDLDRAVNLYTETVNTTTAENPSYAFCLARLEFALRLRFYRTGMMADLDRAIVAGEKAVESSRPDDPNQATWVYNLGEAFYLRFTRTDNMMDLERAIQAYERVATGISKGNPYEADNLFKLAQSLIMRFSRLRVNADLARAIEANREAIQAVRMSDPVRASYLSQLGAALNIMFERTERVEDLEESVQMSRAAVAAAKAEDPQRAVFLSRLAMALTTKSHWGGGLADVDEAIACLEAALTAALPEHADYAGELMKMAQAWRARFDYTDAITDLDEAVAAARHAVDLTPPDHPESPARLSLLAGILWNRSARSGVTSDIDDAIQAIRAALSAVPLDHPSRPGYLAKLAVTLASQFAITADMAHLDEAVEAARAAVETTPPDDPGRADCLSTLGNLLQTRARWTGMLGNLDEAVAIGRQSVAITPPDGASRALHLSMLGNGLHDLYVWTDAVQYLDEAVEVGRQAVVATPPRHMRRPMYLLNLGRSLHARFERTGNVTDLDETIDAWHQASEAIPPDHPQRPMYLNNLARGLLTRFERTGQIEDLDLTIDTAKEAVDANSAYSQAAVLMSNLGEALLIRFERRGERGDLDRAVEAGRAGVAAARPGQPETGRCLLVLGRILAQRFDVTANDADLDEVINCWRAATAALEGSADCVKAAGAWGQAAAHAGQAREALAGFRAAIISLPRLVWRGLDRNVKESRLAEHTGLATAAAAWAIEAGRLDDAVELLEEGRSVLWNQALHTRTDLSRLAEADPELARELEEISEVLERPLSLEGQQASVAGDLAVDSMAETVLYRRAADRWDHLLAAARRLPGFETFLAPTPFCDLQYAAAEGPVVIINVSGYRCDALIVTSSSVQLVPLPDLTFHDAVERFNAMLQALAEARRNPESMAIANEVVTSILAWLWLVAVGPVLQALEISPSHTQTGQSGANGDLPRIWWCPTGPATVFPFHAATSPDGTSALDYVISSYTPSLRALLRASTPMGEVRQSTKPRILAVGMPSTPEMADLPNVMAELETLAAHLPIDLQLLPPDATVARVMKEMATHNWIHLSCHGNSEGAILANANDHDGASAENAEGRPEHLTAIPPALYLSDGALTLARIGELNVQGELAYLSACDTSTSTGRLPDEAFHVTASMQFAGYRHVIGSLWWVTDHLAPKVAESVYAHITANGDPDLRMAAIAVHGATRDLRYMHPSRPILWANYVHVGP